MAVLPRNGYHCVKIARHIEYSRRQNKKRVDNSAHIMKICNFYSEIITHYASIYQVIVNREKNMKIVVEVILAIGNSFFFPYKNKRSPKTNQ